MVISGFSKDQDVDTETVWNSQCWVPSVTGQIFFEMVFTINFGEMGFVHFWHCDVRGFERIRLL